MASEWQQWYQHRIDAWQGSATIQTFTDAAYRAYHNLIMEQFQQPNGKLIKDDAQLAKQSRMGARWTARREGMPTIAEEVLACLAVDDEGFLYSPQQYKMWALAHEKHIAHVERMNALNEAKAARRASESAAPRNDARSDPRNKTRNDARNDSRNEDRNESRSDARNGSLSRTTETERETETKTETEIKDLGAEPSSAPPTPPPFMTLPLVSGDEFPISFEQFAAWEKAFPAVDVENHLQRMRVWLHEHPERMKTRKGIGRFCITWLSREQDKPQGGGGYVASNRNQQRTNGNIEALRTASASIGAAILNWPGGSAASHRECGDIEPVFSPAL